MSSSTHASMHKTIEGILGITILIVLAWFAFSYFGIQTLFTNKQVNETVPQLIPTKNVTPSSSTSTTVTPNEITQNTDHAQTLVAKGLFEQGDSTYTISGQATIIESQGIQTLALTDFRVTNGPDLFVYLVTAPNAGNKSIKQAVKEQQFINLGALKGNQGNQVYTLPANFKFNDQSKVSIWCRRFSRNFGAADLTSTQ